MYLFNTRQVHYKDPSPKKSPDSSSSFRRFRPRPAIDSLFQKTQTTTTMSSTMPSTDTNPRPSKQQRRCTATSSPHDRVFPSAIMSLILSYNDTSRRRHQERFAPVLYDIRERGQVADVVRQMFPHPVECEGDLWETYVGLLGGDVVAARELYLDGERKRHWRIAEEVVRQRW